MNVKIFFSRIVFLLVLFFVFDFLIAAVLLKGLNKCYGINEKPDVLINGTSMTMNGFNRFAMELSTGKGIANYSHEGVSVDERYTMLDYFFAEYPKCVKTVIYEVNPVMFSDRDIAENVYTMFYPYMDTRSLNRSIKERAGFKDFWLHKIIRTKRFDPRLMRLVFSGYTARSNNIKTNGIDPADINRLKAQQGKEPLDMVPGNKEIFEETMQLIQANHARILIVMMPMYAMKLQTYHQADLEKFYSYIESFCNSKQNIQFINLNKTDLAGDPALFSDPIHLNIHGQRRVTDVISPYLMNHSD